MKATNNIRLFLSAAPFAFAVSLALGTVHSLAASETNQPELLVYESSAGSKAAGKLIVAGTSSLHDWEVVSQEIVGTLKVPVSSGEAGALAIQAGLPVTAEVSIRSESLDSGKGGMDKKMYHALETRKHKASSFVLDSLEPVAGMAGATDGIAVEAKGKLTIIGETRVVKFPASIDWDPQTKSVTVTGEVDLLMTDFGVEPPTALLGAIKTGDAITISFEWTPKLK